MPSKIERPGSTDRPKTQDRLLGAALIASAAAQTVAGLLHPEDSPAGMAEWIWGPVHIVFFISLFVVLIGIIRVYGLISSKSGWPGLAAVVLFSLGIIGFEGVMLLEAAVVPVLAGSETTRNLLDETGPLFAGPLGVWFICIAVAFTLGAILFGLLWFRAKEPPRWAGPLLFSAPLFAFEPPVPLWLAKVGLVVFSVGIAGLGWGVWTRSK
jgi:hypothetical protein